MLCAVFSAVSLICMGPLVVAPIPIDWRSYAEHSIVFNVVIPDLQWAARQVDDFRAHGDVVAAQTSYTTSCRGLIPNGILLATHVLEGRLALARRSACSVTMMMATLMTTSAWSRQHRTAMTITQLRIPTPRRQLRCQLWICVLSLRKICSMHRSNTAALPFRGWAIS